MWPSFFWFLGRSGKGNINFIFLGLNWMLKFLILDNIFAGMWQWSVWWVRTQSRRPCCRAPTTSWSWSNRCQKIMQVMPTAWSLIDHRLEGGGVLPHDWLRTCVKISVERVCFQTETSTFFFNPILTGGGGLIWPPPPVRNPRLPRDRRKSRHAFSWVFSFKSCASFDTKFAKIGPSVARSHDVLYSHVGTKLAQNLHFAYVCVQNTWKLLIFLKCTKTVFILSFWPFAQFLISWN